jgi:hypothetical protein
MEGPREPKARGLTVHMQATDGVGGAAQAVGRVILSGLLAQVGAVCRTHGSGRDSSLKVTVGRRD